MFIENEKQRFHLVEITTIEKFSSIYNAERREREINEMEKVGVTARLIPMNKRKAA